MFPRSPVLSRISDPDFQNACWVPLLQTGSRILPSLLLPFNQRQVLRLLLSKYLLNQSPLNGLCSHSLSSGLTFRRGIIASRPPTCSPCHCLPHLLSIPPYYCHSSLPQKHTCCCSEGKCPTELHHLSCGIQGLSQFGSAFPDLSPGTPLPFYTLTMLNITPMSRHAVLTHISMASV